jgi:hypothetical protein
MTFSERILGKSAEDKMSSERPAWPRRASRLKIQHKDGGVISYHFPAKEAGFRKALYRNGLSQTLPFQWCVVSSPGACRNPFMSPI